MERYVSREVRRKWKEEIEVLEYNEIEKVCEEVVHAIQSRMNISGELIDKGDRDNGSV